LLSIDKPVLMRVTPVTQLDLVYEALPTWDGDKQKFKGITDKYEIEFPAEGVVHHRRVVFSMPGATEGLRGATAIPLDNATFWGRDPAFFLSADICKYWTHKFWVNPSVKNYIRGALDVQVMNILRDDKFSYSRSMEGSVVKKTYYTKLEKVMQYFKAPSSGSITNLATVASEMAPTYVMDVFVLGVPNDKPIPGPSSAAAPPPVKSKSGIRIAKGGAKVETTDSDDSFTQVDMDVDGASASGPNAASVTRENKGGGQANIDDASVRIYSNTRIYYYR
jgi:hypothetical protein